MSGRTVPDILDEIGVPALAREFGHVNNSTVFSWKYRCSIPVQHWPAVVAFAAAKGVVLTNDDLVAAHVHAGEDLPAPTLETSGTAA